MKGKIGAYLVQAFLLGFSAGAIYSMYESGDLTHASRDNASEGHVDVSYELASPSLMPQPLKR